MKLSVLQFNPVYKNVEENYRIIESYLSTLRNSLVVLPELCTTGYLFEFREELFDLAEDIPSGNFTKILSNLAKLNNLVIVAGVAEKSGKELYNSAIIVDKTGFVGKYRKINLFFKEKFVFSAGDRLYAFDVRLGDDIIRLGVMICFDWFFPEISRGLMLMSSEIIAHPANLVLPYCPKAMPIRALENKVYTVTANRIGIEKSSNDQLRFIGQSVICSPKAEYLLKLSEDDVGVFSVENVVKNISRDITKYNNLDEDLENLYKKIEFNKF